MELRPSLKMGKSKCAKSPISYLTTAPPEFETFKLLLMAVALPYKALRDTGFLILLKGLQKISNKNFFLGLKHNRI